MKSYLLILFFFCGFITVFSQTIEGVVYNEKGNELLENVIIIVEDSNLWTTSNKKGEFRIKTNKLPIELIFKHIGKKTEILKVDSFTNLKVFLQDDNLQLNEVTVTAKVKKNASSSILLEKQAINLVQAQSLADVLQLLPGKSINESELHSRQILTLRSAIFSDSERLNTGKGISVVSNNYFDINNAFGVSYLVDGIPLSNNANMSVNNVNEYGGFNNVTDYNNLGYGIDLRGIALGNIEKIEVIQGISSAKYGDHTTGLVKIERTAGRSPFQLTSTLRDGSYSLDISKGLKLNNDKGHLNLGVNYLHSANDPRNPLNTYNRIGFNGLWTIYKANFKNSLNISFNTTVDEEKFNPDDTTDKIVKVDKKRIQLSNKTKWILNKNWVDVVDVSAALDYGIDNSSRSSVLNNGGKPIPTSLEEGMFELAYTLPNYRYYQIVNSKPFSGFLNAEISKTINLPKGFYKYEIGANFTIDENFGSGTEIDSDSPLVWATVSIANTSSVGYRPINFNDVVKTDVKFSSYFTNTFKHEFNNKAITSNLGIRYDNFNGKSTLSPRINTIIDFNEKWKFTIGAGYFTKAPALAHLNPGTLYYDFLLADKRTTTYSLAIGQTFVRKVENNELKPSKTAKIDANLNYSNEWFSANLTGYYSKMTDGFSNKSILEKVFIPKLEFTYYTDKQPDYEVVGEIPQVLSYSKVVNSLTSKNYGSELMFSTKKLKTINTSFIVSGAYRVTQTFDNLPDLVKSTNDLSEVWFGYHKSSKSQYETLKSRVTVVHHLSNLGIVISLTAEQFLKSTYKNFGKEAEPYAYLDRNLNYFDIPENERNDEKFIPVLRSKTTYNSNHIPNIFGNYHIKVSKEITNGLQFSFYANNFLNHRPKIKLLNSSGELVDTYLNNTVSFGGKIQYKF